MGSLGCGSAWQYVQTGYSDNWYEYYKVSGICGELYPYEWDLVTPCDTSCHNNYFCTNTATGRLLETWYYFADVGPVRICLWENEKGQYGLGHPYTCSDF